MISAGQVVRAKLFKRGGSVQSGVRPVIIVSNDTGNIFSPTINVVPITTKLLSRSLPVHHILRKANYPYLRADSTVLAEQITTINKGDIDSKKPLFILSEEDMHHVKKCLKIQLDMEA